MADMVYVVSASRVFQPPSKPVAINLPQVRQGQSHGGGRCTFRLVVAIFVTSMFNLGFGAMYSYPAPALPDLNQRRSPFRLSDAQQSWVAGMLALGQTAAGPITGPASDLLGRKVSMMVGGLLTVASLTLMAASTDADMMYVGAFFTAFFALVALTASTLYAAEISPANIRGACMAVNTLAQSFGMLVTFAMGIVLPWNWLAIFLAGFFALPNVVLAFLPESPRLFVLRGNRSAAIHGLRWYRGTGLDQEEVAAIDRSIREESTKSGHCFNAWLQLVTVADQRRSLFLCVTLFILQGYSGVFVLQMFTVTIFELSGSGTILDPNVQSIVVGACCVAGSLLCPLVVDCVGRKALLVASTVVLMLSMAATGAFFQLLVTAPDYARQHLFWLPLASLSLGNFGFMFGLLPVPYILTCEMFPTTTRANAQAVTMIFQGLSGFACVKNFYDIEVGIGVAGAFFIYTGVCAVAFLFVVVFMNESKRTDLS